MTSTEDFLNEGESKKDGARIVPAIS